MTVLRVRRGVTTFAVAVLLSTAFACGGGESASLEGTYTNANGLATLNLRSGGEASLNAMGEAHPCSYTVADRKLALICAGQDSLEFTINEDGSLSSIGTFIGTMTKSKS